MDDARFDALAKALGRGIRRRDLLTGAIAAVVAVASGALKGSASAAPIGRRPGTTRRTQTCDDGQCPPDIACPACGECEACLLSSDGTTCGLSCANSCSANSLCLRAKQDEDYLRLATHLLDQGYVRTGTPTASQVMLANQIAVALSTTFSSAPEPAQPVELVYVADSLGLHFAYVVDAGDGRDPQGLIAGASGIERVTLSDLEVASVGGVRALLHPGGAHAKAMAQGGLGCGLCRGICAFAREVGCDPVIPEGASALLCRRLRDPRAVIACLLAWKASCWALDRSGTCDDSCRSDCDPIYACESVCDHFPCLECDKTAGPTIFSAEVNIAGYPCKTKPCCIVQDDKPIQWTPCPGSDKCCTGCETCRGGTCEPVDCGPCKRCLGGLPCFVDDGMEGCLLCETCSNGECVRDPNCCLANEDCGPCQTCERTVCVDSVVCPAGSSCCGGACRDDCPATAVRNPTTCACDCTLDGCPDGEIIDFQACRCECAPDSKRCDGACIPSGNCCTSEDCRGGETCQDGRCACPRGKQDCGGTCCTNCCLSASNPGDVECCDGGTCCHDHCCVPAEACCAEAVICCSDGRHCCGFDTCCDPGDRCCPRTGECVDPAGCCTDGECGACRGGCQDGMCSNADGSFCDPNTCPGGSGGVRAFQDACCADADCGLCGACQNGQCASTCVADEVCDPVSGCVPASPETGASTCETLLPSDVLFAALPGATDVWTPSASDSPLLNGDRVIHCYWMWVARNGRWAECTVDNLDCGYYSDWSVDVYADFTFRGPDGPGDWGERIYQAMSSDCEAVELPSIDVPACLDEEDGTVRLSLLVAADEVIWLTLNDYGPNEYVTSSYPLDLRAAAEQIAAYLVTNAGPPPHGTPTS